MVSIHAPREGCDSAGKCHIGLPPMFQFTHPGRGATRDHGDSAPRRCVSIHAPREGCDDCKRSSLSLSIWFQFTHPGRGATLLTRSHRTGTDSFNSRTPGGVRLASAFDGTGAEKKFQFTHPGRGATTPWIPTTTNRQVSIHAPREGCDAIKIASIQADLKFQFTHPGRGATIQRGLPVPLVDVSIHAPREGCDGYHR